MDKRFRQILSVLLLGLLFPRLTVLIGGRTQSQPAQTTQPATEASAPTQTQPTAQPEQTTYQIPVYMADGSVQIMDLEEYVCGVVLAEMPASFESEALKAQAVASRTYTMRRVVIGGKHIQGAVCTDSACCQAYVSAAEYLDSGGSSESVEKVTRAVYDTAGEVLTYQDSLIEATYFACSGGRTEDAAAVWGTDVPYLQAVDSPGETKAAGYDREVTFTPAQFAAALGRNLSGDASGWLGEVTYTNGGGVDTICIGGVTYTGTQLRTLLDLHSTAFTITVDASLITISTQGWGHRVGMSQYGADAMAVAGFTYRQILTYYYQGTRIDKLENMG